MSFSESSQVKSSAETLYAERSSLLLDWADPGVRVRVGSLFCFFLVPISGSHILDVAFIISHVYLTVLAHLVLTTVL